MTSDTEFLKTLALKDMTLPSADLFQEALTEMKRWGVESSEEIRELEKMEKKSPDTLPLSSAILRNVLDEVEYLGGNHDDKNFVSGLIRDGWSVDRDGEMFSL